MNSYLQLFLHNIEAIEIDTSSDKYLNVYEIAIAETDDWEQLHPTFKEVWTEFLANQLYLNAHQPSSTRSLASSTPQAKTQSETGKRPASSI